jgi:hypothetical protein
MSLQEVEEIAPYGVLLSHPDLLASFLGASMAPDCDTDILRHRGDGKLHIFFHSSRFAKRLIRNSRNSPRALALALGWQLHLLQDLSANGSPRSYPSQKITFSSHLLRSRNHILAEALLDLLALADPGSPRTTVRLDRERVLQTCWELGKKVPRDKLDNFVQRFSRSTEAIRLLLESIALTQADGILPSLGEFYRDAWEGRRSGLGLRTAQQASTRFLRALWKDSPETLRILQARPSPGRLAVESRVERSPSLLTYALTTLLPFTGDGPDLAIKNSQRTGSLAKGPLARFFQELLSTQEKDYPTFLKSFLREEIQARRRARRRH